MERPGLFQRLSLSRAFAEQVRSAAAVFFALILLGFVLGVFLPEGAERLVSFYTGLLSESALTAEGSTDTFLLIFENNLFAAFLSLLFGLVPFFRLSAFPLGINAITIGALAAYYSTEGPGLLPFLAGTLPHAPFELTALILTCAAGLHLCRSVTDKLLRRDAPPFLQTASECLRAYVLLAVPLLFFASGIETWLTPRVMALFL